MWNAIAGVFASIGLLFGGLFGHFGAHGPMASSTSNTGSTTPWGMHGHMGSTTPGSWGMGSSTPGHMPGIFGTVASVDGTTITVNGHSGPNTATTTYTVDASNAKVIKAGMRAMQGMQASSSTPESVSDIQVGDHVLVDGTVSGDDITATTIIDGIMMPMMGMMPGMHGSSTPMHGYGKGGPQGGQQGGGQY